jgi:hypothetical protein
MLDEQLLSFRRLRRLLRGGQDAKRRGHRLILR